MTKYILFNEYVIESTEPCLRATDRGFMLGDGIFETLRAYDGQLPFWDQHIERLKYGMSQLGFHLASIPFNKVKDMVSELLARNLLSDAYIRLTVSRGDVVSDFLPKWDHGRSNWVLFTKPLPSRLEINQKNGVRAIFSSIRKNSFSPIARLKTVNYLDLILAKREAVLRGAHEAILLDEKGHMTEAATSNLFWIQKDILFTPSLDLPILPGITRKKVLDIAGDLNIAYKEGVYDPEALIEGKEAFLTNSLCEVTPLISIDGRKIGNGRPGSLTRRFQGEYKKVVQITF
jgi:branched-chain amino acid aminotransferase